MQTSAPTVQLLLFFFTKLIKSKIVILVWLNVPAHNYDRHVAGGPHDSSGHLTMH